MQKTPNLPAFHCLFLTTFSPPFSFFFRLSFPLTPYRGDVLLCFYLSHSLFHSFAIAKPKKGSILLGTLCNNVPPSLYSFAIDNSATFANSVGKRQLFTLILLGMQSASKGVWPMQPFLPSCIPFLSFPSFPSYLPRTSNSQKKN